MHQHMQTVAHKRAFEVRTEAGWDLAAEGDETPWIHGPVPEARTVARGQQRWMVGLQSVFRHVGTQQCMRHVCTRRDVI